MIQRPELRHACFGKDVLVEYIRTCQGVIVYRIDMVRGQLEQRGREAQLFVITTDNQGLVLPQHLPAGSFQSARGLNT